MKTTTREPSAPPADAAILKLGEVAYVLRISRTSVDRLVAGGKLATVPLTASGSMRGVFRDDVDRYLTSQRRTEAPAPAGAKSPQKPDVRPSLVKPGWEGFDPFA